MLILLAVLAQKPIAALEISKWNFTFSYYFLPQDIAAMNNNYCIMQWLQLEKQKEVQQGKLNPHKFSFTLCWCCIHLQVVWSSNWINLATTFWISKVFENSYRAWNSKTLGWMHRDYVTSLTGACCASKRQEVSLRIWLAASWCLISTKS